MQLIKSSKTEIAFAMEDNQGITSANEAHMHAVTLKLIDSNTLEQHWVHYVDGKELSQTVFSFNRKS